MKATEIKNYQNLTAKDIVSYMKNNNISTITSGKIEYRIDDIEDSWEYILEKEKNVSKLMKIIWSLFDSETAITQQLNSEAFSRAY